MPVYVDRERNPYRGMLMCHMLADTLDELHAMADALGLRREWFQAHSTPHYDICQTKRTLAIRLGAVEIDRRQTVALIRRLRVSGVGQKSRFTRELEAGRDGSLSVKQVQTANF